MGLGVLLCWVSSQMAAICLVVLDYWSSSSHVDQTVMVAIVTGELWESQR